MHTRDMSRGWNSAAEFRWLLRAFAGNSIDAKKWFIEDECGGLRHLKHTAFAALRQQGVYTLDEIRQHARRGGIHGGNRRLDTELLKWGLTPRELPIYVIPTGGKADRMIEATEKLRVLLLAIRKGWRVARRRYPNVRV